MTLLFHIIGTCLGCAIGLLGLYCVVKARERTSPPRVAQGPGDSRAGAKVPYNSSASAVAAIWLIVNIYAANLLKASRPQLQLPAITYSIFSTVTYTSGPGFPDMTYCIAFEKRLLEKFLTG